MAVVNSNDKAAMRALDEARKVCPLIEKPDKEVKPKKLEKVVHERPRFNSPKYSPGLGDKKELKPI